MTFFKTAARVGLAFTIFAGVGHAAAQNPSPGALDLDFGNGGHLNFRLVDGQFQDEFNALATLADGRFLAAGTARGPNVSGPNYSPNVVVVRFLPDGQLDPAFGVGGLVNIDYDRSIDAAMAMTTLADGSIVIAADLTAGAYSKFGIIKLRGNGSLDTAFGAPDGLGARTGIAVASLGALNDEPTALAVQSDGRLVVAGTTMAGGYTRAAVVRFSADGQLDPGFGGSGTGSVVLPARIDPTRGDLITGIALNRHDRPGADDRITLVGRLQGNSNGAFVTRLSRDGLVDTTFGTPVAGGTRSGNVVLTATQSGGVHAGVSLINAARLVGDGRIVVVGTGGDRGVTFMRLLGNGELDTSFGSQGRTTVKHSIASQQDMPLALAEQGNGRLVAAGFAFGAPHDDFYVARVNANGSPDYGFNFGVAGTAFSTGPERDQARALVVQPSGKLLAAGFAYMGSANANDFALLRLHGDGDRIFAHDFELPQ